MKFIDLTGKRFNRLTVIKRVELKGKSTRWLCKCDCGNETIVTSEKLKSGHTKSCGCYCHDLVRKHGKYGTRIYKIWQSMKARCNNTKTPYYGGRGITVCDEWLNDFKAFYDWAMANGYRDDLTIDRINNDGNYEPSNCRWITMKEQANNTRSNHNITFNGETHSLSEWSRILGIHSHTLSNRIYRGWSIKRAFTEPIHAKCDKI